MAPQQEPTDEISYIPTQEIKVILQEEKPQIIRKEQPAINVEKKEIEQISEN